MQFVRLCKTAVTKHKMLTYKLQTSSKPTYSEQGQEKFDLSLSIVLYILWHDLRESRSCVYGEEGVCICLHSHFCSSCSYPATCQHFSRVLQMCRDNVSGSFRETGCLVKRSCPGSFLLQGVQQELLGWLQRELRQKAALTNTSSARGVHCQSLDTYL